MLLQCSEKLGLYTDLVNSTRAFVLEVELFEAPQVHVYNRSLAQFWRFEASAAAARLLYENVIGNEFTDLNFEQIATRAVLPAPVVHASGVVDRRTAALLTSLMRAEQSEVLNLAALTTSLDRATFATYLRGRGDWTTWQESAGAGFALRAAAAIGRVIKAQRAVTAALVRKHRLFGVGSLDLKLAKRAVRQHGLARPLVAAMRHLGLNDAAIALCAKSFRQAQTTFGVLSYNVSQVLSQSDAIAGERGFASALRHFAARIPPTSKPPS